MKEKGILFKTDMVKAILDGRKTQTRRVMKPQPDSDYTNIGVGFYHPTKIDKDGYEYPGVEIFGAYTDDGEWGWKCPYEIGQRLWVRETYTYVSLAEKDPWKDRAIQDGNFRRNYKGEPVTMIYKADGGEIGSRWETPLFMPRWASRILLEITGIRVEKVQSISDRDCEAEGVRPSVDGDAHDWQGNENGWHRTFRQLWNIINSKRGYSWESNPWCWCIEFKRIEEG